MRSINFLLTYLLLTYLHVFISSRLDYCNSLLYGVGDGLLKKLQAVQNAAARVVTGAKKFDHITPVLRDLHWLRVRQRIKYKLAMTVYKCLRGLAPTYLADDCLAISIRHRWQETSSVHSHWDTICTQDNDHAGDEKFRGCWPSHLEQFTSHSANCNSLPSDVRLTSEGAPVWLIGSASEDYL